MQSIIFLLYLSIRPRFVTSFLPFSHLFSRPIWSMILTYNSIQIPYESMIYLHTQNEKKKADMTNVSTYFWVFVFLPGPKFPIIPREEKGGGLHQILDIDRFPFENPIISELFFPSPSPNETLSWSIRFDSIQNNPYFHSLIHSLTHSLTNQPTNQFFNYFFQKNEGKCQYN